MKTKFGLEMIHKLYPAEYATWVSMRNRCSPHNRQMRKYYYERGIVVCSRWDNFDNFLQDMGEKPSKLHTIDRKDNDGNYEPLNCKWANRREQALNRRIYNLNKTGIVGVHYLPTEGKWRARIKIGGKSIWLGTFNTKDEAVYARKEAERGRDEV